MNDSPMQVKRV